MDIFNSENSPSSIKISIVDSKFQPNPKQTLKFCHSVEISPNLITLPNECDKKEG